MLIEGEERVADGVEDGVVRELERCRKGKGRRIEQRLGFGIAVDGRVRQTRGDEHVEGGRHVDINIDGEVEGIANSTLMEHGTDFQHHWAGTTCSRDYAPSTGRTG